MSSTLTQREKVLNLAKNIIPDDLAVVDQTKLDKYADDAIDKGKATATSFAPSVEWSENEAQNHPLIKLYDEITEFSAAAHLIARISDENGKATAALDYLKIVEMKGVLLSNGVIKLASYGKDNNLSSVRKTSTTPANITYPKNLNADPTQSIGIISRRRGRL